MKKTTLLTLIILLAGCGNKEVSKPVKAQHLEAELISEFRTFQPGEPFWVGLRLVLEEGWHVNWINPGDAGLAPKITWELPEGFIAGKIEWPSPIRIPVSPFMLYGYEDEVLLPVQITPPQRMKAGEVTLTAHADWVVCNEACIPGEATLSLVLEATEDELVPSVLWADKFESNRKKLPAANEDWYFNADISPYRLYINLSPLTGNGPEYQKMIFFPEDQGVINNSTEQVLKKKGNGYQLEIERDRMSTSIPQTLKGVLIFYSNRPEGTSRKSYRLELPLNRIDS